MLSAYLFV